MSYLTVRLGHIPPGAVSAVGWLVEDVYTMDTLVVVRDSYRSSVPSPLSVSALGGGTD